MEVQGHPKARIYSFSRRRRGHMSQCLALGAAQLMFHSPSISGDSDDRTEFQSGLSLIAACCGR